LSYIVIEEEKTCW